MKQPFSIEARITSKHDGMLLRDYLLKEQQLSRRALKAIKFNEGFLLVNGESKTVRYQLKAGDIVKIMFPPEEKSPTLFPEPIPLEIIYEDEHALVINKPADIPVIPSQKYSTGTIANGVLYHLEKQNLAYTVHTVTRLDRDTSGLLLIAKHRHAHDFFVKMQKEHHIHRRYLAVVHGIIEKDNGVIDAPIGRKEGSIIERCVCADGKTARTHYQVVKRFSDFTLAAIRLETGRTHQIRVHFSYLGHPLLGDDLYGGSTDKIKRQALHSFELSFLHPFTYQKHCFQAKPPKDITALVGNINLQSL
ncbi:23S rRNA pseudouridine1911/1915/1917 synthase [Scopulibacillus daqui]|uniref:Pseudouridine synthase n=1 Tax=Scopulibacillus daqui TaxID=1469162 RepID=A0ABS2PX42_9BACL|nr:RluA family pseudouridine synthase [Scopulibacillus daqui]MBM7644044.1 23S rRNA pseudouridine1911/1915/1917 synthase [Scopulibacillus daqui]